VESIKTIARKRRHVRIRKKIQGTAQKPRLCVFKSNNHIYAQIIDDFNGVTITSASTMDSELKSQVVSRGCNIKNAQLVGKALAERAIQRGIEKVIFDRGGFIYHGKIKALSDAAREGGLRF
jgi:large subunit ribosomal protein L18